MRRMLAPHLRRLKYLLALYSVTSPDHAEERADLLALAVYPARAIYENMHAAAKETRIRMSADDIHDMFMHHVRHFKTVEHLRIVDFHRHPAFDGGEHGTQVHAGESGKWIDASQALVEYMIDVEGLLDSPDYPDLA
jgi:hypothetical protein